MRFLFIAPRFHTNQYGAVLSLLEHGHEVRFLVRTRGATECHDRVTPVFLSGNLRTAIREYRGMLTSYAPDVIIIRGVGLRNVVFAWMGRMFTKRIILYTQDPLYRRRDRAGRALVQKRLFNLVSRVRITPVLGLMDDRTFRMPHEYFVPFVVEPVREVENREYFRNGKVNILSIGKFFLERKNHLMLMQAIDELRLTSPIRLTLIGSLNREDDPHFMKIRGFIAERGLSDIVSLKTNVPYRQCLQEYLSHDLFVLPSADEPAAVSPLEAMAHGLAVVCSDSDGARTYVRENKNGFFFSPDSGGELRAAIARAVSDRTLLANMGKEGARIAASDYPLERYHAGLSQIISREFSS